MPRHPPIALKTLDRSHCQYPSRNPEGIVVQAKPLARLAKRDLEEIVALATPCAGRHRMELAQKDQLLEIGPGAAVRQTHHLRGIERPSRRTMLISTRPVTKGYGPSRTRLRTWNPNKSSLYDVIQNRRRARSSPQTCFLNE